MLNGLPLPKTILSQRILVVKVWCCNYVYLTFVLFDEV